MRKDLTEVVFILDRSGSMSGLEAFQQMRKMAESGQFPEMSLDEINEEIRLAREERRQRK